jgi:hypothetical protein
MRRIPHQVCVSSLGWYSPSMAENTKQKIWSKPGVRGEFHSLEVQLRDRYARPLESR